MGLGGESKEWKISTFTYKAGALHCAGGNKAALDSGDWNTSLWRQNDNCVDLIFFGEVCTFSQRGRELTRLQLKPSADLAALLFSMYHAGLRATALHLQLLTTPYCSQAHFVALGLAFLLEPVPWGQGPCLILLFLM